MRARRSASLLTFSLVLAGCSGGSGGAPASDAGAPGASDAAARPDDSAASGEDAGGAGETPSGEDATTPDPSEPPPDPSAVLYDPTDLPRFDLQLPAESIAALEADPRTYARASLRHGDEVVADIGVKLKGEANFRELGSKAALKLKFDEFVPRQTFHGLRRMTLNNSLEDPSFVTERLVYAFFREAGLPAPRANSAVVYVNDELYGVYVNVETEDKTFVRRWYANDDGNLYEETGAEFEAGAEAMFELETNETANDRSDLAGLIAALEAAGDETLLDDLAPVLDTAQFLRFSAAEGIVNQWDGYAYTRFGPNNFRIYHDPDRGKFVFFPWGMDMAMKPYDGDHLDLTDPRGLILARCLRGASCRAAYQAAVLEMITVFESMSLEVALDAYRAQLEGALLEDPKRGFDLETVEAATAGVRAFLVARPEVVRADVLRLVP